MKWKLFLQSMVVTIVLVVGYRFLIGPNQPWMTTEKFFEAIVENLETEMAKTA